METMVTLVSAPAGYGKSVLVSRWADSVEYPVAWISLDESDSDPAHLAAALDEALPGACPVLNDRWISSRTSAGFRLDCRKWNMGVSPAAMCNMRGVSQRRSQARVLS